MKETTQDEGATHLEVGGVKGTDWLSVFHPPHPHTSSHVPSRQVPAIMTKLSARDRVLVAWRSTLHVTMYVQGFILSG